MKPIRLISLLLLIFCPIILNAQYSDFDLSRYKLPDIKTSRLDTYLDFNNRANRYHYMPSNNDSSESRQNSYNGNLNFNYYYFRNTEKYQGQFNGSASGLVNNYKYKNDNSKFSSYNNGVNFALSNINRFYKQNRNFLEVDPELSVLQNKAHSESWTSDENSNDQFTALLSIPVSIGHGKIEPVEDLRLAIYIIEELNKAGRITSLPSDQVLLEMAKEISRIKRQRFFDARLRKIKELQVVDSFLVANNIVSSNDITYFAVLNDQWDYASGPGRTAGFAVNFGIDDQIEINRTNRQNTYSDGNSEKIETAVNSYYLAGFSQVRFDKPINLYWQTSATLKLAYGFEFTRDQKNKDVSWYNYRTDIFNTILRYSIQFIPNSRTSAELSLSGIYSNSKSDRTDDPDLTSTRITVKNIDCIAGFDVNYYFSPQFRIRLNSELSYSGVRNRDVRINYPSIGTLTTSLQNYFTLSLIYSLF